MNNSETLFIYISLIFSTLLIGGEVMNNFILEKLEKVSNLSKSISDDANTAKRALSELLTDKDPDDCTREH